MCRAWLDVVAESPPEPGPGARPRLRSVITTVLLIMISVMIVRDLLVRRWGGAAAPGLRRCQAVPVAPRGVARTGEKPLNRAKSASFSKPRS